MRELLLLSLLSPIAELFPNLYMSWWEPANGDLQAYLKNRHRRFAAVTIVWVPILFALWQSAHPAAVGVLALMVFGAFALRLVTFDRALHEHIAKPKSLHARARASSLPEVTYFIALFTVGVLIYRGVPDNQWLVPLGIVGLLSGAMMMAKFRLGSRQVDLVGRGIFAAGFILNLYNLSRVPELL